MPGFLRAAMKGTTRKHLEEATGFICSTMAVSHLYIYTRVY